MHSKRFVGSFAGGALLLYGLLSLSGTTLEPDARKVDPRLLHPGAVSSDLARGQTLVAAKGAETTVPMFLRFSEDTPDIPAKFLNLGGSAKRIASGMYVGSIPPDAVRYVSNWPAIAYIEGAKRVRRMLDLSRPAVSADVVQAGASTFPPPFATSGLKGDNVYLGFVDTGLYGGHPDFLTSGTGSPSRVLHTYSAPGLPFPISTNPLTLTDEEGHGTHVAGIAAGNGFSSGGTYTGMAPRASLLIGKTSFATTDVVAAVQDLITFAESSVPPRPVAINLSLGLVTGSNDGTSGFESAINSLAAGASGSRRIIAVAAGNEQTAGEHFRTVVGESFGTRSITLHMVSAPSALSFPQLDIWADGSTKDANPAKRVEYDEYTVTVSYPGDGVTVPSGITAISPQGHIGVTNRVDTGVPNGATHITIAMDSFVAGQAVTIRFDRTRNGGTGVIDGYMDRSDGFFFAPETTGTISEPANGDSVVSVGSYKTKTIGGTAVSQGISSFSSHGPTRDGRLKPDVAAPGEFLFSTRSFNAPSSHYAGIVNTNDNYAIDQGTSMSTPHAVGVAALVWQSNPSLTGAQLRERLRRTANLPTDGSVPPNTTWGSGKLSALGAVQNTVVSISGPARTTPGIPISLTSTNSSGGFGAPITGYFWASPGIPLGTPTQPSTTFAASTPGIYTVSLTATAGGSSGSDSRTFLVNTTPAANFTVPASDSAGRSVTFQGTASDPDPQPIAFHWILVSRPAGSAASITSADVDNAVFTPDVQGTYEVGLRTDDGLENSPLVVQSYTTLNSTVVPPPPSSSGGGGGGGCVFTHRIGGEAPFVTSLFSIGILLLPAGVLGLRRFFRLQEQNRSTRPPLC